jgi:hypothetical protein
MSLPWSSITAPLRFASLPVIFLSRNKDRGEGLGSENTRVRAMHTSASIEIWLVALTLQISKPTRAPSALNTEKKQSYVRRVRVCIPTARVRRTDIIIAPMSSSEPVYLRVGGGGGGPSQLRTEFSQTVLRKGAKGKNTRTRGHVSDLLGPAG